MLAPPWFEGLELLGKAWGLMFSLVMISALYSLTGAERVTGLLILLLVPSFLMPWAAQLTEAHWADYADHGTSILYLSLVAYLLARFVATAPQVTSNVIYAAMCLYLVIAFIWGGAPSTARSTSSTPPPSPSAPPPCKRWRRRPAPPRTCSTTRVSSP